jgi:phosphatidate phosphatase APP1
MVTKRPKIISINSVVSESYLSIRAIIGLEPTSSLASKNVTPLSRIRLLKKNKFNLTLKINEQEHLLETDHFGHFSHRIKLEQPEEENNFTLLGKISGDSTLYYLGEYRPSILNKEKKVIISDFDKTLVETKYKTIKEVYQSLTSPVSHFPSIKYSVEFLKTQINNNYMPFILSSSPNFYGPSIKEWLENNQIPSNNIFLKDYRQFLSLFPTDLFLKDINSHGVHKLSQLINIYLMTNIPKEIILIGDNSESDPIIYSIFSKIVDDNFTPDDLWSEIKTRKEFLFTNSQSLKFLNKLYQAKNLNKKRKIKSITKVYIRSIPGTKNKKMPKFLDQYHRKIEYFEN